MPELAEVESERLKVEKIAKGERIVQVDATKDAIVFERNTPSMVSARLKGRKITGSSRKGKYFWLTLDEKPFPVFHLGMSGYISIVERGEQVQPRSVKLVLTLESGHKIVFHDPRRFSRIRFANDPLGEAPISKLGFDPLIKFPTARELYDILHKRKAPIKSVLLDQSIFAGVGNWIADEVLFQAKLRPDRKASELLLVEVTELRKKLLSIVKKAVAVKADYEKFPVNWLFHHRWGKKKNSKTAQGHRIRHSTIGGRTTAWVKGWQK